MLDRTPQQSHCDAFIAANADRNVHKTVQPFASPPIATLPGWRDTTGIRRLTAAFATPRSSFDVWAALNRLDVLLSDYRRLAPRYVFEQLTGQETVAAGNEYRLTLTEAARLEAIESACTDLSGTDAAGTLGGARRMDVRVVRAGPWGGETGEMVVEALGNHAMAGMASLWVLIHGEGIDGSLQVRLDVMEIARWAWAPDRPAAQVANDDTAGLILDWPYLFERLADSVDASPLPAEINGSFSLSAPWPIAAMDERVVDALTLHPALSSLFGLAR